MKIWLSAKPKCNTFLRATFHTQNVVAHLGMTERIHLYPKGLTNSLISKLIVFGIIAAPILVIEFIAILTLKPFIEIENETVIRINGILFSLALIFIAIKSLKEISCIQLKPEVIRFTYRYGKQIDVKWNELRNIKFYTEKEGDYYQFETTKKKIKMSTNRYDSSHEQIFSFFKEKDIVLISQYF